MLQEENIASRLKWLIISRVTIVTFLLGITTFFKIQKTELLPETSIVLLYIISILTYFLSIIYSVFLKNIKNLKVNLYIQTFTDVALITGLVYSTGGIRSIYSVFYPLVIIYSVLFLGKRGGLIIASISSILYGLLLDLEYYGVIPPIYSVEAHNYDLNAGYVFSRIFIHILSFYIIALLASFVVEQEKKTRALLAEKKTAFDKLDLLHRIIIQSVDTGIMTIDLHGRIKSFNRAAESISGFIFTEIENKNVAEVFPFFAHMKEIINGEDKGRSAKKRYNMEFVNKENQSLILGYSVSTLNDNKGKRIGDIVIFQDLTSLTKMEEALKKSRKLAIIGEMAAGLAHEMRNPLASISGSIQILSKDLKLGDTDERLMRIILRGRDQLESIIKDFLLLARPAPGNKETIFINEIVEDVIESIHFVPDWHDNIKVSLLLSDNLSVHANKTEIKAVIWNLVLNAVQAMPEGGLLSLETKNKLSVDNTNEYLEIKVSDTGCGIDEAYLNKIFEPFFTTKEKGTGLGLAIVNRIVEGYNGTIAIESKTEKGTTFLVSLPFNK
ncbi:MAG TPA: ATP-binding protein [Syntrophales bacterium]|nr:ATP-binding protein [Syntrophales bacterium]